MPVTDATATWVADTFRESIVPTLVEYIKIPNKSPMFDPEWKQDTATWTARSSCSPAGRASSCPKARRSRSCGSASARR